MKKKLLIAGGGYADIPLVLAAQKLGFYVITSGNNPLDMAHEYSDETCLADFSNNELMLQVAISLKIDAICPCANDFSAISCAYVAERMNLPGHDSYLLAQKIHHKDSYREFALKHSIPSPNAMGFIDPIKAVDNLKLFQFPVMVKPVDLTGGKGILKASSELEAKEAIKIAFEMSKTKRIVIEDFIEGTRHGFSAFIVDGKVAFNFLDNEHYFLNQYMVSAASTPSIVSSNVIAKLISYSEQIVHLMKLKDGIFHVQFILKDEQPIIIEICRRPPGDLYLNLVKLATSVDYSSYIIKAFTGGDCSELNQRNNEGFYSRHCIMADKAGTIDTVSIDTTVKSNIVKQYLWWHKGDEITEPLTHKLGIVFLKFNSLDEMLTKTNDMQNLIKVKVK
ncbi:Phosphoribosylamine--glycine ligase [Paraglaciecola mesophila]|uniref:Phosphoribosylamine--glycine ligase n=1 Tax=Paraglaciecola mesophila TaxID=197222 RepID=A0A857JRL9_9ALTE|nr:ATP-grasp domain-containing protein [Paraglaciecola mesophila]QHJ13587.1 Phosphoribosylamine--glycine ligase [Paraglaciecola mesophila]